MQRERPAHSEARLYTWRLRYTSFHTFARIYIYVPEGTPSGTGAPVPGHSKGTGPVLRGTFSFKDFKKDFKKDTRKNSEFETWAAPARFGGEGGVAWRATALSGRFARRRGRVGLTHRTAGARAPLLARRSSLAPLLPPPLQGQGFSGSAPPAPRRHGRRTDGLHPGSGQQGPREGAPRPPPPPPPAPRPPPRPASVLMPQAVLGSYSLARLASIQILKLRADTLEDPPCYCSYRTPSFRPSPGHTAPPPPSGIGRPS